MPVWVLTALLIGLVGNLDNFGVDVAYGVPASSNLLTAVVAALGTAALGYAGTGLSRVLHPAAAREESLELVFHPEEADSDLSGDILPSEALMLSVGLGINAWAGGFSYATLWGGAWLGRRTLGHWLGPRASVAAGVLLILVESGA